MKTLCLLRNIAVLFILVAPLLVPRPAAGSATSCTYKPGYSGCFSDKNGNCTDERCTSGSYCVNWGCGTFRPKGF